MGFFKKFDTKSQEKEALESLHKAERERLQRERNRDEEYIHSTPLDMFKRVWSGD